jgi:ubiquinone/menaquinone biosynthesis C-methylase UbiE
MSIKDLFHSYKKSGLGYRSRSKRHAFFMQLMHAVPKPVKLLDVGGTQGYWESMGITETKEIYISLVNLQSEKTTYSNFISLTGDATNLREFSDNSFEVVFSNSVIEHVGDFEAQRRMAQEVARVGKRYFIQTPNYWFPMEPHFLVPGFQWLPIALRVWLIRHFNLGWHQQIKDLEQARDLVNHTRLLTKKEFRSLFPQANLYEEKLFGLTKSFILYAGWD